MKESTRFSAFANKCEPTQILIGISLFTQKAPPKDGKLALISGRVILRGLLRADDKLFELGKGSIESAVLEMAKPEFWNETRTKLAKDTKGAAPGVLGLAYFSSK